MIGAIALFTASILLILETRLALSSVNDEMKLALLLDRELFKLKDEDISKIKKRIRKF